MYEERETDVVYILKYYVGFGSEYFVIVGVRSFSVLGSLWVKKKKICNSVNIEYILYFFM